MLPRSREVCSGLFGQFVRDRIKTASICRFWQPTALDPGPAPSAAGTRHSPPQGQLRNLAADRTRHGLPIRQAGGKGLQPNGRLPPVRFQAGKLGVGRGPATGLHIARLWAPGGHRDNNGYTAPDARPARPFPGSTDLYTAIYVYHIARCISWRSLNKVVQAVHLLVQACCERQRRAPTPIPQPYANRNKMSRPIRLANRVLLLAVTIPNDGGVFHRAVR